MARLEDRIKHLEQRQGLRKENPKHGLGVPSEEIERQFLLAILDRAVDLAKERGEPYQELRKLRDSYAGLSLEDQGARHNEFEKKVAQLAPKSCAALSEEIDRTLARI